MLKIVREGNSNGYSYYFINEDNKRLRVIYSSNGDLYFDLYSLQKDHEQSFTISTEDTFIYNAFNKLYKDIEDANVYEVNELDLMLCINEQEVEDEYRKVKQMNDYLKGKFNYHELFCDGVITWVSDDSSETSLELANTLKIMKDEDKFILKFSFNDTKTWYSNSIRISNSGSRYEPFNIVMMNFYKELQKYDPEHQIDRGYSKLKK